MPIPHKTSHHWPHHGFDNTLLGQHSRLRRVLESVLGRPFRSQWQSQASLVLLTTLKWMRQLTCQILPVLLDPLLIDDHPLEVSILALVLCDTFDGSDCLRVPGVAFMFTLRNPFAGPRAP